MVIRRYLRLELIQMTSVTLLVLLLIFISHVFVRYLGEVAAGKYPIVFMAEILLLEIPHLLGILCPLCFYLSIILVLGRLYADNEMVVLYASGISKQRIAKMLAGSACLMSLIAAWLSLYLIPNVLAQRAQLRAQARSAALVELLQPGQFHTMPQSDTAILVESLSNDRQSGQRLFVAQKKQKQHETVTSPHWDVMLAKEGRVMSGRFHPADDLVLLNGQRFVGHPGALDYHHIAFRRYGVQLPKTPVPPQDDVRAFSTISLWHHYHENASAASELHWRLAVPIAVWVLFFLALPISQLSPRQGRFAKVLPAALIYVLYINLLFVGRHLLKSQAISASLGLWWVHGLFLMLALGIVAFRQARSTMFKLRRAGV